MVEGVAVLLLVLRRDAVHQCLENQSIFFFQGRVTTAAKVHDRSSHIGLGVFSSNMLVTIGQIIVTAGGLALRKLVRGQVIGVIRQHDVLV